MTTDTTDTDTSQATRKARTWKKLGQLLDAIESGVEAKPDWIELDGDADLAKLPEERRAEIVQRLHKTVLRGFRANNARPHGKKGRLAYWTSVAQQGFHDFAEDCWMKCYDSPYVENYDYITPYLEGGLDALDPYQVYSAVLGTWEYSVEDFLDTELCKDVRTIVEPLAGTAELCYAGHFRYPDLRYCMFDLDAEAKKHVEGLRWLPGTNYEFLLGNALDEQVWKDVKGFSEGPSLSYIGKQSQNFFTAKELIAILKWGTTYTDYLMLEVSEPYLCDEEPSIDELTTPEMKAAGFRVALDDAEDKVANPLTNLMHFDLVAWNKQDRRTLFSYHDWIGWQAPSLTAFGRLMDLQVRYYHSEDTEFLSVDDGTETSDCRDNNTFLLFSRE